MPNPKVAPRRQFQFSLHLSGDSNLKKIKVQCLCPHHLLTSVTLIHDHGPFLEPQTPLEYNNQILEYY